MKTEAGASRLDSSVHRVIVASLLGLGLLAIGFAVYLVGARYYATALDLRIKPGMDESEVLKILYLDTPGEAITTHTMWAAKPGAGGQFDKIIVYQMAGTRPIQVIYTADHKVLDAKPAK